MPTNQPFLFHAAISLLKYLPTYPMQCIKAVPIKNKHAPLNAVEGFIRQILGWRLIWLHLLAKMPRYEQENFRIITIHP